jgi:hypothetical protein
MNRHCHIHSENHGFYDVHDRPTYFSLLIMILLLFRGITSILTYLKIKLKTDTVHILMETAKTGMFLEFRIVTQFRFRRSKTRIYQLAM